MNTTRHFKRFAAYSLAVLLAGTTPSLWAAQPKNAPQGGYGMGPGMMGGYSSGYGMGPGMMGGYGGGYGMGSGMMGGYGAMMGGYGGGMMGLNSLNLSDEQWTKIDKLTDELRQKHWALMSAMMNESSKLRSLYRQEKPDPAAIGKIYQQIFDLKRQMIESSIEQQNHIQDILTPEQRQQLRRWQPPGFYGGE